MRNKAIFFVLMLMMVSPFLAIHGIVQSNNLDILPPLCKQNANNQNPDINTDVFDEISKDQANGTRSPLKVNQTVESNKTNLNWLVQNLRNQTNDELGVSANERDIDITTPSDYNRTSYEINIQNISAEPTWIDIEENHSALKYILSSSSSPYAMSFNLSRDSRITDISIYGYLILFAGNYDIEIWNATGVGLAPNTSIWSDTRVTTFGSTTWNVFNNINVNLTAGYYYFVINATNLVDSIPGTTGVHWIYNWDTTFNGGDNVDEGYIYQYVGVWSQVNTQDLSLKLRTVYIDSSNNTLTNMNPEEIDMNMTIDSTVYDVNSTVSNFNFADNDGENKSVIISTNASYSCNLTWTSKNFNETLTDNVIYNITHNGQLVNWITNFTVSNPIPAYGESLTNYTVTIYKPNSNWTMNLALNSSGLNVTNGIVQNNKWIYLSNNTDDILTDGNWHFTFQNPPRDINLALNQSTIVTVYHPQAFVHGDAIQVNATVNGFTDGIVNLTIYNTTNDDLTAAWTSVSSASLGSFVFFNLTVPTDATTGNYTVQIVWSNNTFAGINQTYILVINDTEIALINENEITGIQLIGQDINLTAYFNDTHANAPITGANLTFHIYNESAGHTLVLEDTLQSSATPGYYNYTISSDNFVNGTYQIVVNGSKDWFNNATQSRTFDLVYNTSLNRILPVNVITSNYDPFNLTIQVNYFNWDTGANLSNSNVNYTTNETGQEGNLYWNGIDQTYNIQLNYTDYTLNNTFEINITASKQGYLTQMFTIYWNLTQDVINPSVIIDIPVNKLNSSVTPVPVNWTSSFDLESGIRIYQVFRNGSSQYVGTSTNQLIGLLQGWNNITIVAEDYAGNNGSNWRWIILDPLDPTISISYPTVNNANITSNIIWINGTVDGTGTDIYSVMINDSRFTISIDPSYTPSGIYAFNNNTFIPNGLISIEVNVTDFAGRTSLATRWFNIDNVYPTISITDPSSDGDIDTGAIISISGNADGTGSYIASVMINDSRFSIFTDPSGTPSGAYEFRNNTFIPDGNLGILVNVTDSAGLTTSTTRWCDVDNTYPSISITDPASDGEIDSGAIISISGNADGTGSNITSVNINDSRFTIFTDPSGSPSGAYEFRNNTFIPDGNLGILVNVTDSASLTTSTTRWCDVDNTYPSISITDPASNGDIDTGAIISISGNVDGTGSNIISVTINDSRFTIFTDPTGSPSGAYEFRNNTFIPDGNLGIRVNVTNVPLLTTSATRWFDIDNTNPTISITDPASNGDIDTGVIISISGNADGTGSNIISVMINDSRFTIFTNPSGTPSGAYEFRNNTFIPDGNISVLVNVTDSAALTTSTTRFSDIDNTNPTISITFPASDGDQTEEVIIKINGTVDGTGSNIQSVMINDSRFTIFLNPVGSPSGIYEFRSNTQIPAGNVTIEVNVTDAAGLTSSSIRKFTVVVLPSPGENLMAALLGALLGPKGLDPIILFIVIGAVGVAAIAIVAGVGARRRKVKIEAEKKKTISSVADVANIRHILVIHKGTGIDIFNYEVEKGLDPTLISGFIQAVKGFGSELSRKAKEKKETE